MTTALLAARLFAPAETKPMKNDLLERKLNSRQSAETAGDITADIRAQQVALLLHHIEDVAAMQALVDAMHEHLWHARLVSTSGAPELAISMRPGSLAAWRAALLERECREIGIADTGLEYRGAYVVRLLYPQPCALHDTATAAVA